MRYVGVCAADEDGPGLLVLDPAADNPRRARYALRDATRGRRLLPSPAVLLAIVLAVVGFLVSYRAGLSDIASLLVGAAAGLGTLLCSGLRALQPPAVAYLPGGEFGRLAEGIERMHWEGLLRPDEYQGIQRLLWDAAQAIPTTPTPGLTEGVVRLAEQSLQPASRRQAHRDEAIIAWLSRRSSETPQGRAGG